MLSSSIAPTAHANPASPIAPQAIGGAAAAPILAANTHLRVLTLNAAHGRKSAINQLLVDTDTFDSNLAEISQVLATSRADVVALQEADGPSRWSGGFDHVARLANDAAYPWGIRGNHAVSFLYRYGTAVLSRVPMLTNQSHRFASNLFRPRKGFLISELALPRTSGSSAAQNVDVVSVHLDFASEDTRTSQMRELINALQQRANPLIVLGDFNSEWHGPNSAVRELADASRLSVFQPDSSQLSTYGEQRLDWILVSREFQFLNYEVLPNVISDHRAVVADIRFAPVSDAAAE